MNPLTWLETVADLIDRGSDKVARLMFATSIYVALPALVALVTIDVALRYLFNAPLQWGRDVNGLLLLTSVFCALPHAWDRAYHIRMEVFYDRLSGKRRWAVDALASVTGIIVFGLMAIQAARFVPFMIATGETGEDLELHIWPAMGLLSACAAVMAARVFANPPGIESDGDSEAR